MYQQSSAASPFEPSIRRVLYFDLPAESGALGGTHVDSFGASRDLVVLLEAAVDLRRAAWSRHEHLRPGSVDRGHGEVDAILDSARMRDDGDVVSRGQRGDAPQLGQSAAPVNVGLPDGGRVVLQQVPEAVAEIDVLAGGDARGLDGLSQPAETFEVVGRQAFLHPVDAIG